MYIHIHMHNIYIYIYIYTYPAASALPFGRCSPEPSARPCRLEWLDRESFV